MTLLLDSDVCIDLMRGRRREVTAAFRRETAEGPLRICSVTLQELERGVLTSAPDHRDRNRARLDVFLAGPVEVLPFDAADAVAAAPIWASLQAKGVSIGAYDTQIAGQALRRGLTLVTGNRRHFDRIPGLTIETWRESG
ncbi:PIN domain-containing protein [Roseicella aquatilis]|uniref:Ribonuclease VapC n=1 Tax=Roseicella aquatilis TaxID=2527868 RepID=A0A4R4DKG6_9PROT|nr:PIN domain-containing protein [Roseicella aquatilis]TCZ60906.1 type II toxin-antitoxin system VapC family toxin [Roseicella aquatilis]